LEIRASSRRNFAFTCCKEEDGRDVRHVRDRSKSMRGQNKINYLVSPQTPSLPLEKLN
jgi:hypothetical protein